MLPGPHNNPTDIAGVTVGHCTDLEKITGCTVVLVSGGAVPGVHCLGFATGTRQFSGLQPSHVVDKVNALMLTGGSAFGLESGAGAMAWLAERGIGFSTPAARVPIVPTAVIYDLGIGSAEHPTKQDGYRACEAAISGELPEGCVGAGTGALVGKMFGLKCATKSGLGMASLASGRLIVSAIAVVNAVGDVRDPLDWSVIAGARESATSSVFVDTTRRIVNAEPVAAPGRGENTTLVALITNGRLTKQEASFVSALASQVLTRTISPVGTLYDGDLVVTLSCGDEFVNPHRVGLIGQQVIATAIHRAVMLATPLGGVPTASELLRGSEA